jgi:hypothetical protein
MELRTESFIFVTLCSLGLLGQGVYFLKYKKPIVSPLSKYIGISALMAIAFITLVILLSRRKYNFKEHFALFYILFFSIVSFTWLNILFTRELMLSLALWTYGALGIIWVYLKGK